MKCNICGFDITGSFVGNGDGSGQEFAHPECYWETKYKELEKQHNALLLAVNSDYGARSDWATGVQMEYEFPVFDIYPHEKYEPKSDTLVIHPYDPSTDFLYHIYENIGCDVISKKEDFLMYDLKEVIPMFERVICLGHGCPDGLFGNNGFAINKEHVEFLRGKDLICIWCHADEFMERHNLYGFYSGMFISEMQEAWAYNIKCSKGDIEISNHTFAIALGNHLNSSNRLDLVLDEYNLPGNEVAEYNRVLLRDTYRI